MKKLIPLFLIIGLLSPVFSGCKKDKGNPPVLPPAGSMIIDFTNFTSPTKGDDDLSILKGTQVTNWELAAGAAMIWNTIMDTTLAVPLYSFSQVIDQKPVSLGDKTWQWSASATILRTTYQARLTGQVTASGNVWKMYITKEGTGGFNDFLWFVGTSDPDGKSGQWKLYESPVNPAELIKIDWTAPDKTTGTVKYTYIKSGNPLKDSYIIYGLTSNTLNAFYKISYYNSSYQKFLEMEVEWSTSGHNGRVKCEQCFGNDDWYCWDSNYLNSDCS